MAIVFESFESVKVDGINAGSFSDCVANYAARRVELALACKTFHDEKASAHKTELSTKEAALTTANATIATLEAKIADLEQYRPFDPRILKGEAFYERVSKDDMVTLLASDIPQLVLAGKTIEAYRKEKWPVILDSDDFKGLMAGVHSAGIFDPDELEALTRDATRDEAYGTA